MTSLFSSAQSREQELKSSIAALFKSSDYSDLTVNCRDKIFRVHRNIICPCSEFFKRACKEEWVQLEDGHATITLSRDDTDPVPKDDPDFVGPMLEFLYNSEYISLLPKAEVTSNGQTFSLKLPAADVLIAAKFYVYGDYYGIPSLLHQASTNFMSLAAVQWDSPNLAEAVHVVMSVPSSHDQTVRDSLVKTIAEHSSLLSKPEIESALHNFPDLAMALLRYLAQKLNEATKDTKKGIATSSGSSFAATNASACQQRSSSTTFGNSTPQTASLFGAAPGHAAPSIFGRPPTSTTQNSLLRPF